MSLSFLAVFSGLRTFSCSPTCTWSPTTTSDSRPLGVTPGCDPWSECLGDDVVNLHHHSPQLPAWPVKIVWHLAVGFGFPSKQQSNEPPAAYTRFLVYLSSISGNFFNGLKPFPTITFPLHPWTSNFSVCLPCPPPPLLLHLSSPPSLSALPAWIYCLFGWGAHLDLILLLEPSCLSPLFAGRY